MELVMLLRILSLVYTTQESHRQAKKVTCNNDMCAQRNRCLGTFSSCPYIVSYVSAQTSTSGILVKDVLHLTTEDGGREFVEAMSHLGQSGSFLDIAAPNGLFGLGMEKISVLVSYLGGINSRFFSMCFGHDGIGRISFGDKGSPDQEETPFNVNPAHPTYNVTVTQARVGTMLIDVEFTALFDSGTSFTYMFHSLARDKWHPPDPRIPLNISDANAIWYPV
ncbi:hypothetical protein NC652_018256 [Populus alba x Populus x berolinensis]|nr:hypothetical protein NC652_018256 [Populus alba x Populus x berolinensis]